METDVIGYERQAMASVHPSVLSWQPEDEIRARVRADVDQALADTRDLAKSVSFFELADRPGTTEEDFRQYEEDLGGGRRAVIGLRLRGGKDGDPFVRLCARNFPITGTDDLRDVLDAARNRYAKLAPLWVNAQVGAHETWLADSGLPHRCDQMWLAGPVTQLLEHEAPPRLHRLTAEPVTDTGFHAAYEAAYAELHAESEFHRAEVSLQGEEEFGRAIEAGLCLRAIVEGETAGYIAALPAERYAMRGYVALELFLFAPFRGRGLAAPMQRRLIERMDPSGGAIFFGEIDPGNGASMATARRCGRVEVGGCWWIDL